jgi:hypothetical protein
VALIEKAGGKGLFVKTDVSREDEIADGRAIRAIRQAGGYRRGRALPLLSGAGFVMGVSLPMDGGYTA